MIGVSSFAFGAMENWGLITYREKRILVNNKKSSLNQKQTVALFIAHEISHQWFGNLVTMSWWDNLWLNGITQIFLDLKKFFENSWKILKNSSKSLKIFLENSENF